MGYSDKAAESSAEPSAIGSVTATEGSSGTGVGGAGYSQGSNEFCLFVHPMRVQFIY